MLKWSYNRIIFFSLLMLVKIFAAWSILFEQGASWRIFITEFPFVLFIFCLIEIFARKRKILWYIIADFMITLLYFSLVLYYKHFGIIATYHVLTQAKQVGAVQKSIFAVLLPHYFLLFIDILLFFMVMVYHKRRGTSTLNPSSTVSMKSTITLAFISFTLCLICVIPNRGDYNESIKARHMGVLNYEIYHLVAQKKKELISQNQITQKIIDKLKKKSTDSPGVLTGSFQGKNLIIIQMESFQNFLINLTIDGQEITPNLNELARSNYYFPKFYQQIGQGNTSDAEFLTNTSYYVPPDGAATQIYGNKELPSLPKLLKAKGYTTMNFHTNEVSFWNRDALYQAIGFDRFYDKTYFKDEDAFFYGSSDEVLYRKAADELSSFQKNNTPFYAHIISMSAHNPFTIPEEKHKINLPTRYQDTFVGDYIQAQNYADYALGLFITDLKEKGLWNDSLVVFYGDHRGLPLFSLKEDDQRLMQEILGHAYAEKELINVPLIISKPKKDHASVQHQLGGQVDILPTVANLMGISLDHYIHFGQDLLNQTSYNLLPQRYYLPTGSFVKNEELFLSGSGFEDGSFYTLAGNQNNHQSATKDEFERALKLLQLSDSYVSQLPDRESPKK